ncbi:MAG: PQQ-dependent dehydrogenase, methanol/ethanol family [Proteobacteria bacterium]|nr:MAG: PQQ-dependent dehydrogenase, methanol/ethanol family [Pseudomonadota bacterium]
MRRFAASFAPGRVARAAGFCAAVALVACATVAPQPKQDDGLVARIRASTLAIDDARLRSAGADAGNWLTHGRTYDEQRHSPLAQIHEANAAQLGLAWSIELGTNRGVEATPIAVDGVLFATGPWSVAYAIDARSGKLLWTHDPQVPRRYGRIACCDVVNRGVAVYEGKVFLGTLDGRLLALDAATGAKRWEVLTVDPARAYTITGAPRVVEGRVLIGNGGAELGVRGYVSAYDPDDGSLVWRFYTVPGNPAKPFESAALAKAAKTWSGDWWKAGGGGTVWDSMAYDPELGLVYVGVGNGSPWSHQHRSDGKGDNLFLSSIVALRAATGEYVWHFQTTPADDWDYTATQHMILATLEIGGRPRKVIMQAPKNGFFYVLDRETGEFLSANNYVEVTWASGVHSKTGRPYRSDLGDYSKRMRMVSPSPLGGHNWQPMSFDPKTGLVFFPAHELPGAYSLQKAFEYRDRSWNTGTGFEANLKVPDGWSAAVKGRLIAWDPRRQREVWRAEYKSAWNGGVLTTAGGLVFEGTADGRFVAYRAKDGERLWESPAGTGIVAAPITYLVDGEQYVTVMAGWGGAFPLAYGEAAARAEVASVGRVLTYKLGGTAQLPPPERAFDRSPIPPPPLQVKVTSKELRRGGLLYHEWCAVCHGLKAVSGGVVPDLRRATAETHAGFADIVVGGLREEKGMPSFADVLSHDDTRLIQAYLLRRALEAQPDAEVATP